MSRSRKPYPAEYRAEIVRLVRAGRSIEQLSREFEPSHQIIRNWVNQAGIDDGQENGLTTRERKDFEGCVGRTGSFVRRRRSWQKRRPGSQRRPDRHRGGV